MKTKFLWIACLILFCACQRHPVQLVKSDYTQTAELVDHSPVYFLLEIKNNDTILEVNRKNTISTTNWVFHIDKRCPLKLAIPKIHELQERKKNGMHTNSNASNYFSYTDSIQKSLAFKDFQEVIYSFNQYHANNYIKENPDYHLNFQPIIIDFFKTNRVRVDGYALNFQDLNDHLIDFLDFTKTNKPTLIYLNINQDLLFNDYLKLWLLVNKLSNNDILISPTHFVYDKTKVNCDCD